MACCWRCAYRSRAGDRWTAPSSCAATRPWPGLSWPRPLRLTECRHVRAGRPTWDRRHPCRQAGTLALPGTYRPPDANSPLPIEHVSGAGCPPRRPDLPAGSRIMIEVAAQRHDGPDVGAIPGVTPGVAAVIQGQGGVRVAVPHIEVVLEQQGAFERVVDGNVGVEAVADERALHP